MTSGLLVVVPSPRGIDAARKKFPGAHVIAIGDTIAGRSASCIILDDVAVDEPKTRDWIIECLYCRLEPGAQMYRLQEYVPGAVIDQSGEPVDDRSSGHGFFPAGDDGSGVVD